MNPSDMPKPNISRDLMLIHRIISRGMSVAVEKGQQYLQNGFPDELTRRGYSDYVSCLVSIIEAHHLTEDEVAFPQFGFKIPAAPYLLLSADHQKMAAILEDIRESLDQFLAGDSIYPLNSIIAGLKRLLEMWFPHIGIEESHFTEENIDRALPINDQVELAGQFARHSQEHAHPDYLVIPFMLFNLSLPERKVFSRAMPPVVTEQLVPQVWKEKWQPMEPFLLV